jgi:hypothetical protein
MAVWKKGVLSHFGTTAKNIIIMENLSKLARALWGGDQPVSDINERKLIPSHVNQLQVITSPSTKHPNPLHHIL